MTTQRKHELLRGYELAANLDMAPRSLEEMKGREEYFLRLWNEASHDEQAYIRAAVIESESVFNRR